MVFLNAERSLGFVRRRYRIPWHFKMRRKKANQRKEEAINFLCLRFWPRLLKNNNNNHNSGCSRIRKWSLNFIARKKQQQ